MSARNKKTIIPVTLLVALLAGAAYAVYALDLIDLFTSRQRLLGFIETQRAYAALIFIGLQAVQVVMAPVPGEVTGFVGGLFFGLGWGMVYSTLGLTLGSWIAFMLARLLGRPLVEALVNPETIRRYDYVMRHKGLFLAFLMFLIPGFPKDFLCYLLGLGHMRQRDFLMVSASGRLLGTALLTLSGTYFRDERYVAFSTVIGVGLVLTLIAMTYRNKIMRALRRLRAVQRLRARIESRAAKPEDTAKRR